MCKTSVEKPFVFKPMLLVLQQCLNIVIGLERYGIRLRGVTSYTVDFLLISGLREGTRVNVPYPHFLFEKLCCH